MSVSYWPPWLLSKRGTEASGESPLGRVFDDWPRRLARQFAQQVEAVCAPFSFPCQPGRAPTVGLSVRVATEANPLASVLSIDGVGACDHVHRSAMMAKLLEIPLSAWYTSTRREHVRSPFVLQVDRRRWSVARHSPARRRRGEQGDPLMPLLFSSAIHNAWRK